MILNSERNSGNFNEKLEKSERINVNFNADIPQNIDKGQVANNQDILPNSVRLSSFFNDSNLWVNFRNYLVSEGQRKHSVRNKVGYAKSMRHCHILDIKDARNLLNLTHGFKVHTMKALASLSKFLGRYDEWLDIVKKYQLKWSKPGRSVDVFKSIVDIQSQGNDLESMIKWIRDVSAVLPLEYKNILLFNTLTGLRPDEAQKAVWLIKTKESEYVDKEKWLLKHYQFPSIFLRQTKNAYVSIINDEILELARSTPDRECYYNSLRKRISFRHNFDMHIYYCRKVFATYMRNKGIEPEIIDLPSENSFRAWEGIDSLLVTVTSSPNIFFLTIEIKLKETCTSFAIC